VIVVTYNSEAFVLDCIRSILVEKPLEVIVVDNHSHDHTKALIVETFPEVRLIENGDNLGFGRACNIGAQEAKGEVLVFINPDAYGTPGWLTSLIEPLAVSEKRITTPAIRSSSGDGLILGNLEHLVGFGFVNAINSMDQGGVREPSGFSGCCFALCAEHFRQLGGFDEDFFLYMEDVELSWRAFSEGFKIIGCGESVIFHDYELRVGPKKVLLLEKGRYMVLRKFYSRSTLVSLLPSLLVGELLAWGVSAATGPEGVRSKFLAIKEGIRWKGKKTVMDQAPLIQSRENRIPENAYWNGRIGRMARKMANMVFEANVKVLMR
jgi:GT2 family glycosyltransferase